MIEVLLFILILSFLVIIHELDHFFAAKWAKIKVTEFGLGYPPLAVKLFRKWQTDFTLNWIPFGGFVKMDGEDGPTDESQLEVNDTSKLSKEKYQDSEAPFYVKSSFQRLVVILAGAGVNILFGIIAFAVVFSIMGIPVPLNTARIKQIEPNSPAAQANLPTQVEITAVKTATGIQPTPTMADVVEVIKNNRGQTVTLVTTGTCAASTCEKNQQEFAVYLRTPEETPANQGAMGVVFEAVIYQFYPWYEMPFRGTWFGLQQAFSLTFLILGALLSLFRDLFSTGAVPKDLSGPVGIVHQAQQSGVLSQGPLAVLSFAGMLSINLGVMNVLPLPALDGGRAVMIFMEKIVGKKNVAKVEGYIHSGGLIFLVTVITLVTVRDIFRILVP